MNVVDSTLVNRRGLQVKPPNVQTAKRTLIIVSGRIYVRPGSREEFLRRSAAAIVQARDTVGCRDFVVAADPLESDRVNVYEECESAEALETFRGDGPGEDLSASIMRASVSEHVVPLPAYR